jgi:hypothetical protein
MKRIDSIDFVRGLLIIFRHDLFAYIPFKDDSVVKMVLSSAHTENKWLRYL